MLFNKKYLKKNDWRITKVRIIKKLTWNLKIRGEAQIRWIVKIKWKKNLRRINKIRIIKIIISLIKIRRVNKTKPNIKRCWN